MASNLEEELNKSLTQKEKDILQPIIRELKEGNKQRRTKELKEWFLQGYSEEYNELLEENKKLVYMLEQEIKELDHCKDKDREKFIMDMIEGIKQDIQWNVSVQTQLLEKNSELKNLHKVQRVTKEISVTQVHGVPKDLKVTPVRENLRVTPDRKV